MYSFSHKTFIVKLLYQGALYKASCTPSNATQFAPILFLETRQSSNFGEEYSR
jgi:hypothetical protein